MTFSIDELVWLRTCEAQLVRPCCRIQQTLVPIDALAIFGRLLLIICRVTDDNRDCMGQKLPLVSDASLSSIVVVSGFEGH